MRGIKPAIGRSRGSVEIGLSWTHDLRDRRPARLRLGGRVLQGREIGVEVRPAGRIRHHHGHRRSRHELARVRQELDETLGSPGEPRALQRGREVEARQRSRFPAGDAGKRRADAVYPRLIGMTGRALRLIDLLTGANIFTGKGRARTCDRNKARDEGETRDLHDTRSQKRASATARATLLSRAQTDEVQKRAEMPPRSEINSAKLWNAPAQLSCGPRISLMATWMRRHSCAWSLSPSRSH